MAFNSVPSSQQSPAELDLRTSVANHSNRTGCTDPYETTHTNIHPSSRQVSSHFSGNSPEIEHPLVSLLIPAYNEAAILEDNLQALCDYMRHLEEDYRWEIVLINDGSRDQTAELAEAFAGRYANVHVIHHVVNMGLGQALRTGFDHCQGDYVITLDLDLSYAPEHIERLLTKIRQTHAKVVVTSPYMKGGRVSNVPELRKILSVWANRFLSLAARRNVATLTGMVRVYDARFLQALNLRSKGMEVNPEVIHKAMLMEERIEEIPAHLHWHSQPVTKPVSRKSSMKILRHTWAIFYYGFVFRPVMFFIIPSLIFFLLALYCTFWMLIRSWESHQQIIHTTGAPHFSEAIALAFQQAPHTFIIGGMLMMLSIQLFSLGILAVQSKRYFEEIYYLGSSIYRNSRAQRSRP
ncbi:MAG: glycosyltransferase family 2 protein [Elainella sp.]